MTVPDQLWSEFWDAKARESTEFSATGRGGMDILGFLYTIREVAQLLDLRKSDRLIDVGCGTGIVSLSLSPFVGAITAVDFSAEMVARARSNVADAGNITVKQGNLETLSNVTNDRHDKLLAYSVLQYLTPNEARQALKEVASVVGPTGRALLGANPDPLRRGALIEAIARKPDPRSREVETRLLDRTGWFSRDDLATWSDEAGLQARFEPISPRIWQHFYMFNLVLAHRG